MVNLEELSHNEFVEKANEVITHWNPEGHPPPGIYSPTMKNLIDRLEVSRNEDTQSYASVVKDGSLRLSPSSVQSYNGSVLSADLSESIEENDTNAVECNDKATAATVQAVRGAPKRKSPSKVASQKLHKKMKVSFAALDLENRQHAISTVQETSAAPRRVGSRKVISTERLGDFYTGNKRITSLAVNKLVSSTASAALSSSSSTGVIDFDASINDNSSDEMNVVQDYNPQHDDVLFPQPTVNREPSRRHSKVASLQDKNHTALTSKAVDETDISDASSGDSAICYALPTTGSSSTPAHLRFTTQETSYLHKGSSEALFYARVKSVDTMLGEVYVAPPPHIGSVLAGTALLQRARTVPPVNHGEHVLSIAEQSFCQSQQARWQLLYLVAKDLHQQPDIQAFKSDMLQWPVSMHARLVLMAGAFTNVIWPLDSSYAEDKQKFWIALTEHGVSNFDSLYAAFGTVPFSAVTLEYLLLLPIPAIVTYLVHHRVSLTKTPWFNDNGLPTHEVHDNIRALHRLPAETQVPYGNWIVYLTDLVQYLKSIMYYKEDAYPLLRSSLTEDPIHLTACDAAVFIQQHFPLENLRLNTEEAKLAVLIRAANFAYSDKYSGDVYEQCSEPWAVFLYVIKKGYFPVNLGRDNSPPYDMVECRVGLNDHQPANFKHLFEFERILHGPSRHLQHFLSEHTLAITLYGPTVFTVTVGVQKMMVVGCILYFYMLLNGKRYVDKWIPSSFLIHMLHYGGALAPTEKGAQRFSSKVIPIHFLPTAQISVTAIINARIPLVLVSPMTLIADGTTIEDYRSYYHSALGASLGIDRTLIERALAAYNQRVPPISAFSTDPCLFPRYVSYSIEDYSLGNSECYPSHEGRRMVQKAQESLQQNGPSWPQPAFGAASPATQKRQTTLTQNAAGQVLLQPPARGYKQLPSLGNRTEPYQPKIVNLKQLKANRAAAQRLDREWLDQQPLPLAGFETYLASNLLQCEWSEYGVTASDSLAAYTATLLFHCIGERELTIGDTVVLLHKLRHFDNFTNLGLLNRSHILYSVDHIHEHTVYLSRIALLHTPPDTPMLQGDFPLKVNLLIENEYITLESPQAGISGSEGASHPNLRRSQTSEDARSRSDSRSRRSADPPDDAGSLSEDSEARRMTKKSTMEVNGETFEIYGKTVIRENLLKSTGMRRTMQQGHLVKLLQTAGHGTYGNNITAANIIDGVVKLADDGNTASIFSKLNTAVHHNKLQVTLQAWRQHPDLHEKVAYGIYEFGHNLTKSSVRCEHFLPHGVAVEINYNITTYAHFLEHFKGWRQLLQELLGPDYGRLLQEFLTEMYDQQIGERNGLPYLKALVEAWRCEFHHYSIRQAPFQRQDQPAVYDPRTMTHNDWLTILRLQYADYKGSLTVMKEMEFTQNKLLSKIVEPKPLGHKPKAALPAEQKVGRVEAKVGKDKRAPAKALVAPAPAQAKKGKAGEKRKSPTRDVSVNVCIGDLLNHYGANQQVACPTPCRYVHHTDIAQDTSRQMILQRLQGVAPKLSLTETTIAFMTKKIAADPKFK